jgi:hypothetical protein
MMDASEAISLKLPQTDLVKRMQRLHINQQRCTKELCDDIIQKYQREFKTARAKEVKRKDDEALKQAEEVATAKRAQEGKSIPFLTVSELKQALRQIVQSTRGKCRKLHHEQ